MDVNPTGNIGELWVLLFQFFNQPGQTHTKFLKDCPLSNQNPQYMRVLTILTQKLKRNDNKKSFISIQYKLHVIFKQLKGNLSGSG